MDLALLPYSLQLHNSLQHEKRRKWSRGKGMKENSGSSQRGLTEPRFVLDREGIIVLSVLGWKAQKTHERKGCIYYYFLSFCSLLTHLDPSLHNKSVFPWFCKASTVFATLVMWPNKKGEGVKKKEEKNPYEQWKSLTFQLRWLDMDHFPASRGINLTYVQHEFLQHTPMTNHKQKLVALTPSPLFFL